MKAPHTGAATTTSLLPEVATPLHGFILAAATRKKRSLEGGGRHTIQIHIFCLFRLLKWIGQCYLIIYISDVRLRSGYTMGQAVNSSDF